MHQWGISLPGACEGLCHRRGANGTLEPIVAADLDLVNMFGNAEWPRIREALRTHFPEDAAWTEWQHQVDSVTALPTGATFATNRGAEQGDVLGTIQSVRTPPSPPLRVPWGVQRTATSRAPRVCFCPPERRTECEGCDTPYIHNTVDVLSPEWGTTALGSAFGSREHIHQRTGVGVSASL